MTTFKKFVGNYIEICDTLGIYDAFYALQTEAEYVEQIEKDIARTSYVSNTVPITETQERLQVIEHLQGNPEKGIADGFSFTQGNFDGGSLTRLHLSVDARYADKAAVAGHESKTLGNFQGAIRIAYIDDNNNLCGVAVEFQRQDPEDEKDLIKFPEPNRPRLFTVAVIRNTVARLEDRQITYFSHPSFLTEQSSAQGNDIDSSALPDEIAKAINSSFVSGLLVGLFNDDRVNMEKFNYLHQRLIDNHNLDNRDFKKLRLDELLQFARNNLPENLNDKQLTALLSELEKIEKQSNEDSSFYLEENFKAKIKNVTQLIGNYLENPNQNLQRQFKLTANAILLDLHVDFKRSMDTDSQKTRATLLAQANVLRTLRDNPKPEVETEFYTSIEKLEPNKLISRAEFRITKERKSNSDLVDIIITRARENSEGNKTLELYLNAIELKLLTEPDFFKDGVVATLDKISNTVDVYIDAELKNPILAINKLTLQALKLEYLSKAPDEEILKFVPNELQPIQIGNYKSWLAKQASLIRNVRDKRTPEVVDYKDIATTQELVGMALQRKNKRDLIDTLLAHAEKNSQGNKELEDYLEKIELQLSNDPNYFYDNVIANLEEISKTIDSYIDSSEKDSELINPISVSKKLTVQSLILDHLSKASNEELLALVPNELQPIQIENYKVWLAKEASLIRDMRDQKIPEIVDYKNISTKQELVGVAIRRTQALHAKLAQFEKSIDGLLESKLLVKSEYADVKQTLENQKASIQKAKSDPANSEVYRNVSFNELMSQALTNDKNKKQESIKTEAQSKMDVIDNSPAPEHDSFITRNRNSLLVAGFALVTLISLILILTGVFAPVGIVLEGIAVTGAFAGAILAGAALLGAIGKLMVDELELPDIEENLKLEAEENKNKEINKIQGNRDLQLSTLNEQYEEADYLIKTEKIEDPEITEKLKALEEIITAPIQLNMAEIVISKVIPISEGTSVKTVTATETSTNNSDEEEIQSQNLKSN